MHGRSRAPHPGAAWASSPSGSPHQRRDGALPQRASSGQHRRLHSPAGACTGLAGGGGTAAPHSSSWVESPNKPQTLPGGWPATCQELLWHRRAGVLLSGNTSISRKHSKKATLKHRKYLPADRPLIARQGICDQQETLRTVLLHVPFRSSWTLLREERNRSTPHPRSGSHLFPWVFQTPPWFSHKPTSTSHLPLLRGLVSSARSFPLEVRLPHSGESLGFHALLVAAFPGGLGHSGQERETYLHHQGLMGGGVSHWWQQLFLPDRRGKLLLVEILSGHSGSPVAPGGGCVLALRKGAEGKMLLGTAKQSISHDLGVQEGFGIVLVGAPGLSGLRRLLQCRLQVFSVTRFWLPFRLDFCLVSGRLVSGLKRNGVTVHLQASLGPLMHWGLVRPFVTRSLSGQGLLSAHRRLLAVPFGQKLSILRIPGCRARALVMRLPRLGRLVGGAAADVLPLLLALLMSIPTDNLAETLGWHCWWVHLG